MRRFLNLLSFRRRRMERDLLRELEYHLNRRSEELMASGLSGQEARRQAVIEFGQHGVGRRSSWHHCAVRCLDPGVARFPGGSNEGTS